MEVAVGIQQSHSVMPKARLREVKSLDSENVLLCFCADNHLNPLSSFLFKSILTEQQLGLGHEHWNYQMQKI